MDLSIIAGRRPELFRNPLREAAGVDREINPYERFRPGVRSASASTDSRVRVRIPSHVLLGRKARGAGRLRLQSAARGGSSTANRAMHRPSVWVARAGFPDDLVTSLKVRGNANANSRGQRTADVDIGLIGRSELPRLLVSAGGQSRPGELRVQHPRTPGLALRRTSARPPQPATRSRACRWRIAGSGHSRPVLSE